MPKISRKLVKWKVTVEGVEIPWKTISLQVGIDSPGQITVDVESDPVLRKLRAGMKIHLWMYDDKAEGDDEDLDKLFLFWEGDLQVYNYTRAHASRVYAIAGIGEFASFGRSKMFAHGFGTISNTHLVSGSVFVSTESASAKQLLNYTLFGNAFNPETPNNIEKEVAFRDTNNPNYSERLLRLLSYFSSYNALFRLQMVRSNLFGKIVAFQDDALGRLLPRALASDYFNQGNSRLPPESTILDVIATFNNMMFYHYSSMAGPVLPTDLTTAEKPPYLYLPGVKADNHIYAMPRRFLRNDYILLPETYYAIPPSCNMIFPEHMNQFSLTRDLFSEPTRAIISNTHLNAQMSAVAPDTIFRYSDEGRDSDPASFWSINKDGIKGDGNVTSPYQTKLGTGKSINLFGAVSDEELERGIITVSSYPPFEFFSAVSNVFDLKTQKGRNGIKEIVDRTDKMAASVIEGSTTRNRSFLYMMKALADYTYTLEKFRRNVSISLVGHRWIVPGFPCVIMASDGSYLAYVKRYALSISAEGDEMSNVDLDFVRPFPEIDFSYIKRVEKASEEMAKIEDETKKADEAIGVLGEEGTRGFDEYTKGMGTVASTGVSGFDVILGDPEIDQARRSRFDDEDLATATRGYDRLKSAVQASHSGISSDPAMLQKTGYSKDEVSAIFNNFNNVRPGSRYTQGAANAYASAYPADTQIAFCRSANDMVQRYVAAFKETMNEAVTSLDAKKIPNNPWMGDPTKDLRDSVSQAKLADNVPSDFMTPPIFGNLDLLSVAKAEKIYNEIFGAKKALSGLVESQEVTSTTTSGTAARVLALKKQAYTRFANFAKALNRVFPVIGRQMYEDEGQAGSSEWEQVSEDMTTEKSVRDWAEEKYIKRERLQSLRHFLKVNGLKLEKPMSEPPTPMRFMRFVPSKVEEISSPVGNLTWDNTLFSKVVDEFQIRNRTVKVRDASGNVSDLPKSSDSEILKLRKSVKDPFLTTKARQSILIDYSSRHFGSRGYGGS